VIDVEPVGPGLAGEVLIVQPIHAAGLALLAAAGLSLRHASAADMATVAAEVGEAVAVVTRSAGLSGPAMEAAPKLRVVGNHGVGVDPIDLPTARRLGIVVVNTPGTNARAVAELTVALMLATLRRLIEADRAARAGDAGFKYRATMRELSGRTVGLIGFGEIGRRVGAMLRGAFDVRLLVHTRPPDPEGLARVGAEWVPLERLAAESDVVSLHLPGAPGAAPLVDAAFLARMRPDAILINTARGSLVDTEALVRALNEGRLAGAGLDTVGVDLAPPSHPLLALERVVVTPHVGGSTEESLERTAVAVATRVVEALRDRRPEGLVDPEVWPARRRAG
jgi:D-3-phosphoglycerate dehydrogenase / 2-oxoglutarate reductase